jgi:hypothetical protein
MSHHILTKVEIGALLGVMCGTSLRKLSFVNKKGESVPKCRTNLYFGSQNVNAPARRRIAEASPDFKTCWMLLETPSTSSTKSCRIGLATITIQTRSRSRTSTRGSRLCVVAGEIFHAVLHQPGKQIPQDRRPPWFRILEREGC